MEQAHAYAFNSVNALLHLDPAKYRGTTATEDGKVIVEELCEVADRKRSTYMIEDVLDFAKQLQDCFQEIWERNEDYPDQIYLACIACEMTLTRNYGNSQWRKPYENLNY